MPTTTKQHEASLSNPSLASLLPIRDLLDNVMVRTDGSYVAGFRLRGSLTYFAADDELNAAQQALDALIRSLEPEVIRVQFRYEVNEKASHVIDRYSRLRRSERPAAVTLDVDREHHYRALDDTGEFLSRTLFAFLIWKPPVNQNSKRPTTEGKKKNPLAFITDSFSSRHWSNVYRLEHEQRLERFEIFASAFMASLKNAGLEPERLSDVGLLNELDRELNGSGPRSRERLPKVHPLDRFQSARERIARVSLLSESPEYLNFDGLLYSVITMKELPDVTRPGLMRELLTLGFPLSISVHFTIPDQSQLVKRLGGRRKRMAASLIGSKGEHRHDHTAVVAQEEIDGIIQDLIRSSQKAVRMSVCVTVRSSNVAYTTSEFEQAEKEVAQRRLAVQQAIGRMEGATATLETFAARRLFISQLGGLADADKREHTMLSRNAADFLPVEMIWNGTDRSPILLFETPYRQAFTFSPFDPQFANANGLITAGSGTGKSVLVGKMLLTFARTDVMVSILERGSSYERAVEFMGGQTITVSLDSDEVINPWDLEDGTTVPSAEQIAFLRLLARHMAGDTRDFDTDILDSILSSCILETYRRIATGDRLIPTFSDLVDELKYFQHENPIVKDMARLCAVKLDQWVGDGPYARLLDRHTTVRMDTPWMYFNIEKLKDDPRLELAMSIIIANATTKRASGKAGVRCLTVMDECWSLLDSKLAELVEQLFRTARKRNASVWGVSQSIEDFTGTTDKPKASGGYMLTTIGFMMLGRQDGSLSPLEHFLKLNPTVLTYLSEMPRTEKGVRSSFLLIVNKSLVQPVYVVPTPIELWIMTSYPREIAYRRWWLSEHRHLTLIESYKALAELYPQGLADLDELPEEIDGRVAAAGRMTSIAVEEVA